MGRTIEELEAENARLTEVIEHIRTGGTLGQQRCLAVHAELLKLRENAPRSEAVRTWANDAAFALGRTVALLAEVKLWVNSPRTATVDYMRALADRCDSLEREIRAFAKTLPTSEKKP